MTGNHLQICSLGPALGPGAHFTDSHVKAWVEFCRTDISFSCIVQLLIIFNPGKSKLLGFWLKGIFIPATIFNTIYLESF